MFDSAPIIVHHTVVYSQFNDNFLIRALVYIIPALVMAVVVSLPRFVEVDTIIDDKSSYKVYAPMKVETAGVCLDLRGCSDQCEYFIE